jgi:hypothetical protein
LGEGQLVIGRANWHNAVAPDWKATVPAAPEGSPVSERVAALPKGTEEGLTLIENAVGAGPTVWPPERSPVLVS